MRLLFLSQYFQPEPFFRALPFAKSLGEKGFEVEVLTGFPNYPGGKIYSGYKVRAYSREVLDGVTIHRTALYPNHDNSAIRRIANYLSFGLSSLVFGASKVKPAKVIYCYSMVTTIFTAKYLRWRHGSKIVFDIQDLWPESVSYSGMMNNRWLQWVLKTFCDWAYRQADHITVISPGFKRDMIRRGIASDKVSVVYNWCEQEEPVLGLERDSPLADEYGLKATFNVMYAGNMGAMQSLGTMLDAAKLCRDKLPDVRFVLVGGGMERAKLEERTKAEGLHNVVFLPRQAPEAMARVYTLADAVVVHLKAIPLFELTVPSKTQAYMAAGLPILMGVRGDAADLVEQAKGGCRFEPENPQSFADAVARLHGLPVEDRQSMGRNNREYYMKHLARDVGVAAFAEIFRRVGGEEASA